MKRELAAAIAIPIVLAILFLLPPAAFDLLVGAVALLALWEFYRLAEKTGHPVAKTVGLSGGAATLFFGAAAANGPSPLTASFSPGGVARAVIGYGLLVAVAPLFSGLEPSVALAGVGSTLAGVALVALPATALCSLRAFSPRAVLFLFLIVWGCDSAAYYVGRKFGRRRLAPVVSPKKTWEGSVGGFLGAAAIGGVAGTWLLPELGVGYGAIAGAVASTAGQIGDLVESLWKRGAGVKDSGVFLPGHGGFYDRIDSLLFAGPVLAAFLATLK